MRVTGDDVSFALTITVMVLAVIGIAFCVVALLLARRTRDPAVKPKFTNQLAAPLALMMLGQLAQQTTNLLDPPSPIPMLMAVLFLAIAIVSIVWIVRQMRRRKHHEPPTDPARQRPLRILTRPQGTARRGGATVFGLLRPCSRLMDKPMQKEWMSHFCGLCLALRDDFGQSTRLATNYDGLVLSALVEAQTETGPQRRTAGPCPLRGMRTTSIVHGTAARLSAVASVLLVTAKINDHIADGDGLARRKSVAAVCRKVSRRLETKALRVGDDIAFDAAGLLAAVQRQSDVEAQASALTPLTAVTAPTEAATAALFAHTAVIAQRPSNVEPLARAGRAFGRLAHLVDAVADLEADAEAGSWNPLAVTETSLAEAHRLCHAAIADIDAALADAGLAQDGLARSLLVDHADHTMRHSYPNPHHHHQHAGHHHNVPQPRGFWAGCGAAILIACTCQCCCSSSFEGPWTRKPREGCCHKCDCSGCDCCCCPCDGC